MRTFLTISLLALCVVSCYKQEDYALNNRNPDEIIADLTSSKTSLSANGADKAIITAWFPKDTRENVDVTFTTTKGAFTNSNSTQATVKTKLVLHDGVASIVAEVELRNGLSEGNIHIEAAVALISRSIDIASNYNYPIAVQLGTTALALSNDAESEIELTAQLVASSGTVSQGHQVIATVYDEGYSTAVGSFRITEDRSNSTGGCRYVYSLVPDTTYIGVLHVVASTTDASSAALADTLDIYATP